MLNCYKITDLDGRSNSRSIKAWEEVNSTNANDFYYPISIVSPYCCLSSLIVEVSPLLGFAGATLAGVDRSALENWIKNCIRIVTIAKPIAEKVMPFHEEKSDDPWRTLKAAKMSKIAQEMTTCYFKKTVYIRSILNSGIESNIKVAQAITTRDLTGRLVFCSLSSKEPWAICLSNNLSCLDNQVRWFLAT